MDAEKWFNLVHVVLVTPILFLNPPARDLSSGKKLSYMDDRNRNTRRISPDYPVAQHGHARSRSNRGHCRDSPSGSSSSGEHHSGSSGSSDTNKEEGYDEDFVPPVDARFICPICLQVLRKPSQTECGHRFCRNCIKKWLRSRGRPECPVCNNPVAKERLFPDNFAHREILNFHVRCHNSLQGCDHLVELQHLEDHLRTCNFGNLPCPNSCHLMLLRKDLDRHLTTECSRRQTPCSLCQQNILVEKQQQHYDCECPEMSITCNFCKNPILRKEYSSHTKLHCPKAPVECEFKMVGCRDEVRREDLPSHWKSELERHMRYLLHSINHIYQFIRKSPHAPGTFPVYLEQFLRLDPADSETTHRSVPSEDNESSIASGSNSNVTTGYFSETGTHSMSVSYPHVTGLADPLPLYSTLMSSGFTIPTISSEGCSREGAEPVKYTMNTSPLGDRTRTTLAGAGSHAGAYTCPIQHFPGTARVMLPELDQAMRDLSLDERRPSSLPSSMSHLSLSNLEKQMKELVEENKKQGETISKQDHSILELQGKIRLLEHRLNAQVSKNHEMSENLVDLEARLCNGLYVWKIDNYKEKRRDAMGGMNTVLHSSGFYTSMFGYKICIRVNLNGIESAVGRFVSVFIHFMKGKYDDIVEWPFRGQITLAILDQSEGPGFHQHIKETLQANPAIAAFQRPTSHRNHKGFGYMEYAPIALLENSDGAPCFLKNDTLVIKAIVKE